MVTDLLPVAEEFAAAGAEDQQPQSRVRPV